MGSAGRADLLVSHSGDDDTIGALQNVAGAISSLEGAASIAAGAGIAALGAGLTIATKEAMENQDIVAQLDATLESTGQAGNGASEALQNFASAMQDVTRFTDEQVISGQTILTQFHNLSADVMPKATAAVLDFATRFGMDVPNAARLVGKALADPAAGFGMLSRYLGKIPVDAQKAIDSMIKMGDVEGAQTAILGLLNNAVGGAAEAAGKTLAGQLAIAKNRLLEMAETVGKSVLPALSQLMDMVGPGLFAALNTALPSIEYLGGAVQRMVSNIAGGMPPLEAFQVLLHGLVPTDVFNQLNGILLSVGTFIDSFKANVLPKLQEVAASILNSFSEAFGAQGPQIIANIKTFFDNLGPALSNVMTVLGPILEVAGKALAQAVAGVINILSGLGTAVTQLLAGDFGGALKTIGDTLTSFANSVSQAFGGVDFSAVLATWGGVLANAGAIITGAGANALAAAQEWGSNLVNSMIGGLPAIAGNISGAIGGAIAAIQGMVGQAAAVGSALVAGIAGGIKAGLASVVAAAVAVVEAAIAAAKAAAGVSSPSKVMAEMGGFMTQGLAIGITDQAALAIRAMNNLQMATMQPARETVGAPQVSNSTTHNNTFNIAAANGQHLSDLMAEARQMAGVS